jgi:hypothetical protein
MDIFSAMVAVLPLIIPLAQSYGIAPEHLAIVFLANLEIGYVTPPVGMNLFISSLHFRKSLLTICKNVLPFIALLGVALMVITYVPSLSTWLPEVVDGKTSSRVVHAESLEESGEESLLDFFGDRDEIDELLDELGYELEEESREGAP